MKTVSISITQLENLLEVAKSEKERRNDQTTNIVVIQQVETTDHQGGADKLRFYLQSAWAECNDHFLGHN